jgi:acetyl esterase
MNATTTAITHAPSSAVTPSTPGFARLALRAAERNIGRLIFENLSNALGALGHLQPGARPSLYDVELIRDLPYDDTGLEAHKLDLYRPTTHAGPWPVVLYIHGGSFRVMSKDTHWMMAIAYARRGYLVVNVNYRLAPQHPFPAALQDVSKAWLWVVANIGKFGGDPSRIVVAGDSAGANLATALAIETTFRRPEPWAAEVFEAGRVPAAVVAACGILQVSEPDRYAGPGLVQRVVHDRITEVRDGYLPPEVADAMPTELADPLLILESDAVPARPLPPFFAPVGGADPLLDDTVRLERALTARAVPVEATVYEQQTHVFHAFTWAAAAKRAWADTFRFLGQHLPARAAELATMPARRPSRRDPVSDFFLSRLAA